MEKTILARNKDVRTDTDIVVGLSKLRADVLEIGFNDYDVARLMTAASELMQNILKYAEMGNINYSKLVDGAKVGIEFIATDNGPGIDDIELALVDNYSTSGTLGLGLPGVKRLVDEFELNSETGNGTTVALKVWMS